jgi:DEAD/DEAH box helicase domain-containing protein
MCGVLDGDTPGELRRRLRDQGRVIFSNPDMVHAAMMPQHARWSTFLGNLSFLVLDELHVYNGIFGSNMAWALSRLFRLCAHYGSTPGIIACSATIANPGDLARKLTGRSAVCIREDGSPRGRRLFVFWNPPRIRNSKTRSRRSANVEAHELMARLVRRRTPVITFSKAKMTAEMIHRYVVDSLRTSGGGLAEKVAPYRGGYLPRQRRALEKRLFSGELLGVSATPALELGIDIGALEASIIVGYPGTLSSFLQQAGRAGRGARDSVVFLVGLDTSVNQYIMHNPAYIFDRCVEEAVIDPRNPHVLLGQLRCAAHELPIESAELARYGPCADLALRVLNENHKIARVDDRWYHAAAETPQHEVSLRSYSGANVVIRDIDTGEAIGEIDRFDAEPILHPEAIYMHQGQTFRVLELDLDRNRAAVRREDTDYYTQPLGGTDIHHIDNRLREKRFGSGMAYWGEVTAHFNTYAYEKIHFYSLDALSVHGLDLPVMVLETMALWIVAPEDLMAAVRKRGMDVHAGLRGIGYATRMALPLFITCDTLDFSHTIGSVNAPWNAIFIYERYPLGLGFTEKAYERLHEILPAVYDHIVRCRCRDGCPCCVGKPLRGASVWNVERGEAHIPSKSAALAILEGLLGEGGDLMHDDSTRAGAEPAGDRMRTEDMLRRRLERMREPCVFHPITPLPHVRTATPPIEERSALATPDVARRSERRRGVDRTLHKRIIERIERRHVKDASGGDSNGANGANDSQTRRLPTRTAPKTPGGESNQSPSPQSHTIALGDSLAARARTQTKRKQKDNAHE